MAVYAIGDVQGCYQELLHLLEKVKFDDTVDQLWFTGDLVNRGPSSLATLRFVRNLGHKAVTVLGNHDLHLLAVAANPRRMRRKDTLTDILAAPDCDELLAWLRSRAFLHHDPALNFTLVHAGLHPTWNLQLAKQLSGEAQSVLAHCGSSAFFHKMYGNTPARWSNELDSDNRIRFIINCFTRMRFLDSQGRLDFQEKGPPGSQPPGLIPWYEVRRHPDSELRVIFGHWSTVTLGTPLPNRHVYPLDTGCIWGGKLTAMRLDCDSEFFRISCQDSFLKTNL